MGVAKVILNGDTLIDTTGKTVEAGVLASNYTALDRAGEDVVGTANYVTDVQNASGVSLVTNSVATIPDLPDTITAGTRPTAPGTYDINAVIPCMYFDTKGILTSAGAGNGSIIFPMLGYATTSIAAGSTSISITVNFRDGASGYQNIAPWIDVKGWTRGSAKTGYSHHPFTDFTYDTDYFKVWIYLNNAQTDDIYFSVVGTFAAVVK